MSEPGPPLSKILRCYACQGNFPRSQYPAEHNEDGNACCPDCSSEFVELFDQTPRSSTAPAAGTPVGAHANAEPASASAARGSPQPAAGSAEPRNPLLGRGPRIEFHATFDRRPIHGARGPLSFVDAISRFAPVSLPNGQQAFVLQVQDGALLSPFTMGVQFGDALTLNPADWVVGDDLDAVVSRVLDAYMPPRRSTAQEVRDALPRLQVRPGPLSPRPTAGLEAAAAAAEAAASAERAASGQLLPPRGTEAAPGAAAGPGAGLPVAVAVASSAVVAPVSAAAAVARAEAVGSGPGGDLASAPAAASQHPVRVRLELGSTAAQPASIGATEAEGEPTGDLGVRLTLQLSDPGQPTTKPGAPAGTAAASGSEAEVAAAVAAEGDQPNGAGIGGYGYASCQPGELCTVCHDAFEAGGQVVELPCRHCFHEDCIMPWLQQQNTCPVCRKRLAEESRRSAGTDRQPPHQPLQPQPSYRDRQLPTAAVGSSGASDRQGQADRSGDGDATSAASASAADAAAPARAGASAGPTASEQEERGRQQPSQLPQPLRPRVSGTRSVAVPLFGGFAPMASAALHPPPPLAPQPPLLSREALQAAEAAFATLRTRFPPLSLAMVPPPPPPQASMPFGELLLSMGGSPGAALRGRHGAQSRRAATQQSASGLTNSAPALRAGFLNQPINLYGSTSPTLEASGVARGGSAPGAAAGAPGTRSALRGGFFNSAGGGGAGSGITGGSVTGSSGTAGAQRARSLGTAPASGAQAASSRGGGSTRQAIASQSTGAVAASPATATCQDTSARGQVSELAAKSTALAADGKAQVAGTGGATGADAAAAGASAGRAEPEEEGAAAAASAPNSREAGSADAGGSAPKPSGRVALDGGSAVEGSEDERPTRQVARRTRQQDAASLAHTRPVTGDMGAEPAPLSNRRAVKARVVRRGRAAAITARGGAATASVVGSARNVDVAAGGSEGSQWVGPAETAAATVSHRMASSAGGARSGGGSGVAAATGLVAGGDGQRRGGGGGGGFNPLSLVVGGAGAGLRFLGGMAAGLLRRGGDGGASRRAVETSAVEVEGSTSGLSGAAAVASGEGANA